MFSHSLKTKGGKEEGVEWEKREGKNTGKIVVSLLPSVKVLSTFIVREATREESETGDAREWGGRIHEARKWEQRPFGEKLHASLWKFTITWYIFLGEKSIRLRTKYEQSFSLGNGIMHDLCLLFILGSTFWNKKEFLS